MQCRGNRPSLQLQVRGNPFPTCCQNRPQSGAVWGDGSGHSGSARPHAAGPGAPLLTTTAGRSFNKNPDGYGCVSPPSQSIPGRPVPLSDSLSIVAGAAMRAGLFPQLFPIPDPTRHLVRQPESELMREHTHLPTMVGFVSNHVAQHFRTNWPRRSPAVSAELLDAAPTTAERFSEHLRAASGALGQSRAGLLRCAVGAVELSWNLQVRSCKPDPLGADIVHVREDRRNGAGLAGRFGSPGGRVKTFDKNLVHAIIGGKDLDCGSAELSVNLVLTRCHGSLLLDL
jgi:hypothetical protein